MARGPEASPEDGSGGTQEKKRRRLQLGIQSPLRSRSVQFGLGVAESMGSSNLASLSEAGGNGPYHPISGPLPPHLKDDADRVGTRPTP